MQRFRWTIEIEMDESWVADGFDLGAWEPDVLAGRIMPYATEEEMTVRIVKAPSPASIRKAQGYTD